jgi:hypothetical protein
VRLSGGLIASILLLLLLQELRGQQLKCLVLLLRRHTRLRTSALLQELRQITGQLNLLLRLLLLLHTAQQRVETSSGVHVRAHIQSARHVWGLSGGH